MGDAFGGWSGGSLEVGDHLTQDLLVEDLLLLGTAGHQGVGADQVDLAGYPLGVVVGLGDEAIAEERLATCSASTRFDGDDS